MHNLDKQKTYACLENVTSNVNNDGGLEENVFNFIKWSTVGINKFPKKSYAYLLRAKAKFKLEDNRGAISDLNANLKINPSDGEAHFLLGNVQIFFEEYTSAFNHINLAIKLLTKEKDKYLLSESYISRGMIKIHSLNNKEGGCMM